MKKGIYDENGVSLSKKAPRIGDTVELRYNGLLRNSGAIAVKAHIGYNETWEDVQTIDMEHKDDAFTVSITLAKAGTLNAAFVDPAGNWDNNSGKNYVFKIAKAPAARKASKSEPATAKKKTRAKKASEPAESEVIKAKKEAASALSAKTTRKTSASRKAAKSETGKK